MRIYHLGGPTGQRSYSGNVISMPKQLNPLVNMIPRLPSDCDIFMINQETDDKKYKKDFMVRRWALKLWIDYLLENNDAYADVELDEIALNSYSDKIEGQIPSGIKRIDDPNLINTLNNIIDKENKKSKKKVYSHVNKKRNDSSFFDQDDNDDEKEDDGLFFAIIFFCLFNFLSFLLFFFYLPRFNGL